MAMDTIRNEKGEKGFSIRKTMAWFGFIFLSAAFVTAMILQARGNAGMDHWTVLAWLIGYPVGSSMFYAPYLFKHIVDSIKEIKIAETNK